jgi:hypothetical protein
MSLLAAGLATVAACSTTTTTGASSTTAASPTSVASDTTAPASADDGATTTTHRSPSTTGRTGTTGAPPGTLSPSQRENLLSAVLTPDDLDAAWTVSRKPRIRDLSIAGDDENLLFSDDDCPGLRATVPALADDSTYPAAATTLSRTDGGTESEIEEHVVVLPDADAASQIIDLARSDEYLACGRQIAQAAGGTIEPRAVDGVGDEATAIRVTSIRKPGSSNLVLVRIGPALVTLTCSTTGDESWSPEDLAAAVQKAADTLG